MTNVFRRGLLVLAGVCGLASWAQANEARLLHYESLQQLELRYADGSAVQKVSGSGVMRPAAMRFNALGRHFDLDLTPNHRLLDDAGLRSQVAGIGVYRGELNEVPGSWVRLVIDGERTTGLISDGDTVYALEWRDETNTNVLFRLDDLEIPAGMLSCGAAAKSQTALGLLQKTAADVESRAARGPGATTNLNVAAIGDFEFTSDKGAGNAVAEMITRMNNVDGIFSEQLGVQLTVNRTDTFASSDDPFSDTTVPGELLNELADYRDGNADQHSNGLTHLFTGRNLDGTTVGIAFLNAVCSRGFGAGLTQTSNSVTSDSLVAAHEIGHNFGAPHDGTDGSPCESTPQDFLMAPRINGSDEFSACSIDQMQSFLASPRAGCLTDLPNTDVAISVDEAPATALLGNSGRISFAVDSVGTEDADNVSVDLSIPGNVTLDSVSATSGSCTTGAGTATCTLGSIASGSGFIVSVIATLDSVGDVDFVADVSAAADSSAANNQATASVSVTPAVDLVTSAANATVTVDQSATLQPGIDNQATIAANNVEVSITPDAGLRIDTASWPEGSCSLDAGVATCTAATLAAGATTNIELGVTGTAEGTHNYAVTVSADETDRDTSNNDASGAVTVNAVAPPPSGNGGPSNDDGGGGASGLASLAVLLFAIGFRLRRYMRGLHQSNIVASALLLAFVASADFAYADEAVSDGNTSAVFRIVDDLHFLDDRLHLGMLKADRYLAQHWDLIVEKRESGPAASVDRRSAVMAAAYRRVGGRFKLGFSYSYTGLSDDVRELMYDDGGVFLSIVGRY